MTSALEALLQPTCIHQAAAARLDEVLADFDARRTPTTEEGPEKAALDRLRTSLRKLKDESISERLRTLAVSHADAIGEPADVARRHMMEAYDVRSKLVHHGRDPKNRIDRVATWMDKAVPKILLALAERAAGATGSDLQ